MEKAVTMKRTTSRSDRLPGSTPLRPTRPLIKQWRPPFLSFSLHPSRVAKLTLALAPRAHACEQGLVREDLLLSLGSVSFTNHDNLRAVAALVACSESVQLPVAVLRGSERARVEMTLTPRSGWGGRGLLG